MADQSNQSDFIIKISSFRNEGMQEKKTIMGVRSR